MNYNFTPSDRVKKIKEKANYSFIKNIDKNSKTETKVKQGKTKYIKL